MRFLRFLFFLSASFYIHIGVVQANDSHVADRHRTVRKVLPVPDVRPAQANKETVVRIALPKIPALGTVGHEKSLEGIDVSHYQGRIDWHRVAKEGGVRYAYIKASEGENLKDEFYDYNVREARAAGIVVGAYHFYRPQRGVEANFSNMVSTIKRGDIDLLPIIDVESTGGVERKRFLSDLGEFVKKVEKHYGCPPMLYTGQNFYNKHFLDIFTKYCWMIAKYQETEPVLLDGNNPCMWQYTQHGRMPGIKGNVDRSRLMSNDFHHLFMERYKNRR